MVKLQKKFLVFLFWLPQDARTFLLFPSHSMSTALRLSSPKHHSRSSSIGQQNVSEADGERIAAERIARLKEINDQARIAGEVAGGVKGQMELGRMEMWNMVRTYQIFDDQEIGAD